MLRALALLFLWSAAAWGAPLSVVATSTDLKSLVEAVGGEKVKVESLAPPLGDPHAVEVKPAQLARIKSAALLVRIGLDHEPWLGRALAAVGDARFAAGSPNNLDASHGIELLQAETPRLRSDKATHLHGFGNTHYWLDPENARPITAAILEALARLDSADSAYFEANRKRFTGGLEMRLKDWLRAMEPYRGAKIVVTHETWPYFARRFGLDIVASIEPTPGVPPSASYLAELTRRMREAAVKIVVAEPYANFSVVNQVAERGGARAVTLISSVGGDPEARDYLSLFDVDIKRFTAAARH
ncbi:MAG TPA: metal ABC transporter substrate-binding protein [Candidatus Binatia bacterium]|nr:metal ABC transporter substrate-binding protein [Candidatus Binatia bacterium]